MSFCATASRVSCLNMIVCTSLRLDITSGEGRVAEISVIWCMLGLYIIVISIVMTTSGEYV